MRLGATISPAASTSGRCSKHPLSCQDNRAFAQSTRSIARSASKDAGRRIDASKPSVTRCNRVSNGGDKRAAKPLAAIGVHAAGVLELEATEVVTADLLEEERSKAQKAQAAIAALKEATQDLQAHFNITPDGAVDGEGEWDGFTVSTLPIATTRNLMFVVPNCIVLLLRYRMRILKLVEQRNLP